VSPRLREALPPVAPRPDPASHSDRVNQIVVAARRVVETQGADALTMRRLGDELGIKAPSLYKHLASRDAVIAQLVDETLFETGGVMHAAVDSPTGHAGPVPALLAAYREFGRAHPNLYRLVATETFPRAALTTGLEAWAGEPFYRATGDPYRAQALWAFAHGTLILEIDERVL
jgi:AcrR family transcriptional regulator